MKKFLLLGLGIMLAACGSRLTDEEKAALRISEARRLIAMNQLNNARMELDSVHVLYPRQVPMRRVAKYLADSIDYMESKRMLAYCDSMLVLKQAEAEKLKKNFRLDKDERYQDVGNYVYKLLRTESNAERCYLQATVSEKAEITLKSTYCGAGAIKYTRVELASGGETVYSEEVPLDNVANHSFTDGGLTWQMLSLKDEAALSLLNFISTHQQDRIKVSLLGGKSYVYYLMDSEKKALGETYHFAIVMRDIARLEKEIRKANYTIGKFFAEEK